MKKPPILPVLVGFALWSTAVGLANGQSTPVPDHSGRPDAASTLGGADQPALAKGHNTFTMHQAKARIRKAGYREVSKLTKSPDGLWQGVARLNGKRVTVSLDYKGDIVSQRAFRLH
jgi:hypothetical protein